MFEQALFGDGEQLIQALRDEDDGGSRCPELEQDAMQGRSGIDVQAASRIHGDQDPWSAERFPAEEQALLVSARELANPRVLVRRPDLEGGHEGTRLRARRRPAHERPTGNRGHAVVTQDGALGDGEGWDQALAESILGNIGDASPPSLARAGPRDVPAVQGHAARQRRPQAGDDLEELPLTAAGNAGDAQDLVAPHLERHLVEGDPAAVADRAHLLHHERR